MTTAGTVRARPNWTRVQVPVVVLMFAWVTWLLTRRLLEGRLLLPALAVAAALTCLVLVRTRAAALVWLLVCASILPARLLPLSFGGVRTDLAELLGFALVGAVLARAALGEELRRSSFTGPLVAIVVSASFGALVATLHGAGRDSWLALLKSFFLYLVPLAFVALFDGKEHRDLLERWIHRICTFGGLWVLGAAATGRSVPSGEVPEVVTLGVSFDALRLRPALLTLTLLATLLVIARTSRLGATRTDVLRLLVYGAVVAVSFTRSTWVPLVLAIAFLVVLRPGRRSPLRGLRAALAVVAVVSVSFMSAASGDLGSTPKAITVRIESIGSDKVLEENSYQDRKIETTNARQRLAASPFTGVGLGQPYGAVRRVYDPVTGARSLQPRRFIHNSVLGFWLWAGLPGLLALIWLTIRTVQVMTRSGRGLPEDEGARAVAAGLTVLALGLQSTFQTSLTSRPVLATLACAIVFLDVPLPRRAQTA